MTHGIDTDFLVAAEIIDHPFHQQADTLLRKLLADGHDFAIAPQTLAEFIHVVTDARRFPQPLTSTAAIQKAEDWWLAQEVLHVFPGEASVTDFIAWLRRHQLGRKRLLDTLLAATFRGAGVTHIITNNARDFERLGDFEIVGYK
jgi:predicted nucleic acid-binding protein